MEHIRTHGIHPKIFNFEDIDRVEIFRKTGYRRILVYLKNNSYSARADLRLKNTDENIDLFMAKVRQESILVNEEPEVSKANKTNKERDEKKQGFKHIFGTLKMVKASASDGAIFQKGEN